MLLVVRAALGVGLRLALALAVFSTLTFTSAFLSGKLNGRFLNASLFWSPRGVLTSSGQLGNHSKPLIVVG